MPPIPPAGIDIYIYESIFLLLLIYKMARFFEKHELIFAVLIILLFDLNGFCEVILPQLLYEKDRNIKMYIIVVCFLLFDMYVFHTILYSHHQPSIQYSVEKPYKHLTCEEHNQDQIKENQKQSAELETICKLKPWNDDDIVSERIVFNFIILILILLMILGMVKSEYWALGKGIATFPILLIIIMTCIYTNILANA
jgi:hypothetical protein